jgi:hypothetical protein
MTTVFFIKFFLSLLKGCFLGTNDNDNRSKRSFHHEQDRSNLYLNRNTDMSITPHVLLRVSIQHIHKLHYHMWVNLSKRHHT